MGGSSPADNITGTASHPEQQKAWGIGASRGVCCRDPDDTNTILGMTLDTSITMERHNQNTHTEAKQD